MSAFVDLAQEKKRLQDGAIVDFRAGPASSDEQLMGVRSMAVADHDTQASEPAMGIPRSIGGEATEAVGARVRETHPPRAVSPWVESALDVALDRIAGSAFVVASRGRVVHASASGRALLRADRVATEARIASSPRRFAISKSVHGGYEVVVLEPAREEACARADAVGSELGLSARESEVLGLLANGLSNRLISQELGCAEKTVEGHVSNILAKTDCPTRSGLVARFWTHSLRLR